MSLRVVIYAAVLFLLSCAVVPGLQAGNITPAEKAKIEALIGHLESLKDATFVRNGSDYDSKTAAKFLRRKWQAGEGEIKTAADFISKAATKSSTSGKPYLIRANGLETPCADYLTAHLKKLETAPAGK